MDEAEIRALDNLELATLAQAVTAERDRRSRLSSASSDVAELMKRIRSDGGDLDQVIGQARTIADTPPPVPDPEGEPPMGPMSQDV